MECAVCGRGGSWGHPECIESAREYRAEHRRAAVSDMTDKKGIKVIEETFSPHLGRHYLEKIKQDILKIDNEAREAFNRRSERIRRRSEMVRIRQIVEQHDKRFKRSG